MPNEQSSNPPNVVVVTTSQPSQPEPTRSETSSQNENVALELGQVLESHRQTLEKQEQLARRLADLETQNQELREQMSTQLGKLLEMAEQAEAEEQEELTEDVELVQPEPEPEPEKEPEKEPEPKREPSKIMKFLLGL